MLTCVKNWIYRLIVESHVVYNLLSTLGPWYLWYVTHWYKGDAVTDDSGRTMKVTKWKGRNVTPLTHRRYATIKDIQIRKDDVFVCGYPKTGCHWTYEIVYMLKHKKAEVSKCGKLFEGMIDAMPDIFLDSIPSPRVFNSHVLYDELPSEIKEHKNKIILTIRCPKDTVVSFYHHTINLGDLYNHYDGTLDDYFKMFMRGEVDHADYFDTYLAWGQVMEEQKNDQIFLLEFEHLKEKPVQTVMELAKFLDISITQEFAEEVADATCFSKLKEKRNNYPIFRKGIVGDWKSSLTKEQSDQIDKVWREKMVGSYLSRSITRYCN